MRKEPRFQDLYDGLEGKEIGEICSCAKFEDGTVKIQCEIARKGKSALQIEIHKGDSIEQGNATIETREREELLERKEFGPIEDELFSYAFSMYISNDFPIVPTRLVLAQ